MFKLETKSKHPIQTHCKVRKTLDTILLYAKKKPIEFSCFPTPRSLFKKGQVSWPDIEKYTLSVAIYDVNTIPVRGEHWIKATLSDITQQYSVYF